MMMRLMIMGLAMVFAAGPAYSAVQISIDKDNQVMTVDVDGVTKYRWPVSSGLPAYETPNGNHRAFRMEEDHFSKEWDDAPMPHSIFFTKRGHAIHGTDSVSRLGKPASHGCVRLSRANAATLFALVKEQGVLNTTVTLTGSSQVALARGKRSPATTTAARRPAQQPQVYGADVDYGARQQQAVPDGYVFDGENWVYDARLARNTRRRVESGAYYVAPPAANPYAQPRYYYDRPAYAPQRRSYGYYDYE